MFPFAFEHLPAFLLFMVTFTKKTDCNWKLELDCEVIKFVFFMSCLLTENRYVVSIVSAIQMLGGTVIGEAMLPSLLKINTFKNV